MNTKKVYKLNQIKRKKRATHPKFFGLNYLETDRDLFGKYKKNTAYLLIRADFRYYNTTLYIQKY